MNDDFKTLAAQLRDLQDASKAQAAGVLARAEEAGLDPGGLRRFVSWKRKDEAKRAQQEAIDQQCRYLAGERDTPAQLPIGCELAQAINLYRRDFTVRQVAEEMHVSTGKAGKLKQLSRMFDVHVHATVDKPLSFDERAEQISGITDVLRGKPREMTLADIPHNAETGEITQPAGREPPPGESAGTTDQPDGPGSALANSYEVEVVLIDGLGIRPAPGCVEPSPDVPANGGEGRCGPDATPAASRIDYRSHLGSDPQGAEPSGQLPPSPQPDSHSTGDDGLEIPTFLDRRAQA